MVISQAACLFCWLRPTRYPRRVEATVPRPTRRHPPSSHHGRAEQHRNGPEGPTRRRAKAGDQALKIWPEIRAALWLRSIWQRAVSIFRLKSRGTCCAFIPPSITTARRRRAWSHYFATFTQTSRAEYTEHSFDRTVQSLTVVCWGAPANGNQDRC